MAIDRETAGMDRSLAVGRVAETLPDLDAALADPRLRRVGLVGGGALVALGAVLAVSPWSGFWTNVLSGLLAFVGVPLFCVGIAAPEPDDEDDPFRLGVELAPTQRRTVAAGAATVVCSPLVAAALGPALGSSPPVLVAAAAFALAGAALMLAGLLAWTSQTLAEGAAVR